MYTKLLYSICKYRRKGLKLFSLRKPAAVKVSLVSSNLMVRADSADMHVLVFFGAYAYVGDKQT